MMLMVIRVLGAVLGDSESLPGHVRYTFMSNMFSRRGLLETFITSRIHQMHDNAVDNLYSHYCMILVLCADSF